MESRPTPLIIKANLRRRNHILVQKFIYNMRQSPFFSFFHIGELLNNSCYNCDESYDPQSEITLSRDYRLELRDQNCSIPILMPTIGFMLCSILGHLLE